MAAARKPARTHAPRLAREQRVDEILVSARDVFCEKGYEASSVAEIAARIGVVEGLVYKYFSSKRELLLKVLENWYDELFGDCERDLAAVDGHRPRVRLLIWRHLRAVRDYPQLCKLMFREVREEPKYKGSELHARNRRYTQFLVGVIEDGQRAGVFRADVPARLLRDLVYGGIEHVTWNYMVDTVAQKDGGKVDTVPRKAGGSRSRLDIETTADQIATLLCEGLMQPEIRTPVLRKTPR